MAENALINTIITRREIDPLLLRAWEVSKSFQKATGIGVSVLDRSGHNISEVNPGESEFFCKMCRSFCVRETGAWKENEYPCTGLHIKSIEESKRRGGPYIYRCDIGFMFMNCPLWTNGRFAGALIAGLFLGVEPDKAAARLARRSCGRVTVEEAAPYFEGMPKRRPKEVKAIATLLSVCAGQLSQSAGSFREILLKRSLRRSSLEHQISAIQSRESPYPLEKERLLLAALRRGDHGAGRKLLNELLRMLFFTKPENFKFMQIRATELAVLLSRAAVGQRGLEESSVLEENDRNLRSIQETRTEDELVLVMHNIVERMSASLFSFQGIRHSSALRKAERFIWANYTRKISLKEIADASGLSAPYFSTIFKEEMGENLSSYLNRLRVEKATAMLAETDDSLQQIAGACGFEDQSWFSKIFKSFTGISPGKYREQGGNVITGTVEEIYRHRGC